MKQIIYADNAATTKLNKKAYTEMISWLAENYANPSQPYAFSREPQKALQNARMIIAQSINALPEEIFFTSGGTESDNWAIKGIAFKNQSKKEIITSEIEHHAILNSCLAAERMGSTIKYIHPDRDGIILPEKLEELISEKTDLVSVMFSNNEIGTIEPIKELAQIAHKNNALIHTDAVQAVGSIEIDVNEMNIDLLSMSAHKLYGPKGTGALYIRGGVKLDSLITGGGQEKNKRAGTENIAGIVGLGKAVELAYGYLEENNKRLIGLRDRLIKGIQDNIQDVRLNGHPTKRLPGNVNFCFRYIEGEALLLSLDLVGIAASSGSACTSGSLDPSHVLLSIGLAHEIAHGSLRLSLGASNTEEDIDYTVEKLVEIVDRLRKMSPLYNKMA